MVNPVGSVTAEIILDTTKFEEAIGKLKGEVKEIKESFTKSKGNDGLLKEVEQLKKEIDSLQSKTKDYKKTISDLRDTHTNYNKEINRLNAELKKAKQNQSNFNQELRNEKKDLDNVTASTKRYVSLQEKMTKHSNRWGKHWLKEQGMGSWFNLTQGGKPSSRRKQYGDFSYWIKQINQGMTKVGTVIDNSEVKAQMKLEGLKAKYAEYNRQVNESISLEQRKWGQATQGITGYINLTNQLRESLNRINNATGTKPSNNVYMDGELVLSMGESWRVTADKIKQATTLIKTSFVETKEGVEVVTTEIGKVSEVLSTFNFKLLEFADTGSTASKTAIELASAMQRMNVQGTKNWSGRNLTGGYSTYISSMDRVNKELATQARLAKEAKLANEGLSQAYNQTGINLNTYRANITKVTQALERQKLRTAQVEAAQASLYYKNAPNNLNTYKANITKINEQLQRQTSNQDKVNNSLKTGQASMRQFGTTMGKSEAYANNLYRGLQKVRSVIVSIKTIAGALGTMAIWNFAFDLIDKAKETYIAKNEMEALLAKNSHVDAQGQQAFNKALDDTINKFQKINKYSLGETAASVGLEFDLNGKQMAESLKVIAMVQNEYVRAGRTTEEAALAVKDILQGEFMRLSRETGVGKDDLMEKYGWNGNKDDVESLMKALKKAGEARHWDAFAEKATSLNDVLTITQSRFSEFGADLITNIEPMFVGGFNTIIGVIDKLKTTFDGMNGFEQMLTIGTVGGSAIVGLSSAILMLKKNIGLVDIATMGWGRSMATAITGLKRSDVLLHGFWRTLIATISGTDAATTSNIRFSKVLAGRILGVNQAVNAEHGLMSAMVAHKMALKGELNVMNSAIVATGNFRQKLIYLAQGEIVADKASATWGKTLKSVITSTRLLRIAIVGLIGVGLIAWLGSIAMWTSTVKKRIDAFNDTINNGAEKIKDAKDKLSEYEDKLAKLSKNSKKYDFMKSQRDTAEYNVKDLELSLKLAKKLKKQDKELSESHDLTYQSILKKSYEQSGINTQKGGQNYLQMRKVAYDLKRAEEERSHFLYASNQHINEHVKLMKEAGISEEKRVDYITEYSAKAEEAAKHLKEFNEGNLNAGLYYLMDRAALAWIDLWNDKDFVVFWNSVKKTFNELKPTLIWLKNTLIELGKTLMKFFSTDVGRWTLTIGAMGAGIGLVVGKLSKWISGNNLVIDGLKKLGSSLVNRIKDWKNYRTEVEKTNKETGGTTTTPTEKVPKKYGSWGELGSDIKQDFMGQARKFAKVAGQIALAMGVLAVAIASLSMPMIALAATGALFKRIEPQIKDGIDGLKLIAPVMAVMLPPVVALMYIMNQYGKAIQWNTMGDAFLKSATGIAMGITLVTEAIFLLNMPMIGFGSLGAIYGLIGNNVQQGIKAIDAVNQGLMALVPWIPVFAGGIILGAMAFTGVGAVGFLAAAVGIAMGITLVTEAIFLMYEPLSAIGTLGALFKDLSSVKRGTEAIKVTAEALTYVSEAMASLALIAWADLGRNIASIISNILGVDLTSNLTELTKKDGFLDKLNTFAVEFNKKEYTPVNQDKANALKTVADGMGVINDAMKSVKSAMDNLPDEFKNGNGTPSLTYDAETDKTSITGQVDVKGYFDTFKEPLKQLKAFVDEFNTSPDFDFGEGISQERVAAINSTADMVSSLDTAVQKVKTVMQNVNSAGWETNMATGGIFASIGGWLGGLGNSGGTGTYKSSLGSSFQEMEDILSDLTTFSSRISGYSGQGGNVDISGLVNFVQQVSTQISNLKTTISTATSQLKTSSKGLGGAIGDGLLEGFNTKMATVTPQLGTKLKTLGTATLVPNFKNGIDKMSEAMGWELYYVGVEIDNKKSELGTKAYNLAQYVSEQYKNGLDMHSPGLMARTTQEEVGYIGQFLQEGISNLPQMAYDLGNSIASNFNFDLNLSNIQLPDISSFQQGISQIIPTVSNVKTQVSTNFQSMVGSVGTSLTNLKNNATSNYNTIVTNTRTSLSNMQSQTTKNIGGIKTSWRGMQTALIASAEAIRSQTQTKINKIKTNLGDFWNKVKHPDQLLASAGGKHVGSIHRSRKASVKTPSMGYAGSGSLFKPKPKSTASPSDLLEEYLSCMATTGSPCYAGWSYNWTPSIVRKFKGWNTHFNAYSLDKFLNVGKFENSNFPVKGNADVAKAYIFDVIRSTSYGKYFNSRFGDDPVAALRAGVFNCWDGTNIVLGLARAFGFYGNRVHGSWNGVGHVWASIPGLGIIDPTAIQQRGSFKATGAVNYGGGSKRPLKSTDVSTGGDTYNTNVEIHVHGNDVEVDNRRIDNRTGKQLLDILGINPATGR